ncbi:hypothetical protein AVEN_82041-1 [Araneus ventricosus]|uniref:Uncharacterized protein n=1 Tax=Araneus ventricosus TaxID=182803 RepID=A0A4Y2KGQ5_ARAVE|nr:hypothetical protein AVEN_82041-1 [Araneus ventricosus]
MTMDLTLLKTQRKSFRTSFTVCAKKIDDELLKEAPELTQLSILKSQISDKFARLETCQAEITNLILKTEDAEQAYEEDFLSAEKYRDNYIELCSRIEQLYLKDSSTKDFSEKRKFKLPKIELKKFDGDAKNYLSFWSQFRKIHEDSSIPNEDKFQYLLQAVVPKSKAARVVESFPATADNYQKAISQLQERFGRNDLLVQIYVRDLLSMVMKNAATGRSKTDLPALYDELEAKIRALESLGRTQEKYGDFLSPLVESCLPEEVLVAWERSRNHSFTETKESRTLEQLMNFLRQEVKGEEMVNLARTGFASNQSSRRKELHNDHVKQSESTTASALVSLQTPGKRIRNCIFCDKSHPSEKCFSARKMTLAAKQKLLLKKGACFSCLKKAGHLSKFCNVKNQLNCSHCNNRHFDIMCDKNNESKCVPKPENSLANCSKSETIFLQTLCVLISYQGQQEFIHVLMDSGSQSSYISEKIITQLKASPLRTETVIHALFGRKETKPTYHEVFPVEVSNLNITFSCSFEVLSEKTICGFIPRIENKQILNELKRKKIDFTDSFRNETEINLLIGADVLGKLLTGNTVELESGLTAVETKLGWTVFGKGSYEKDNILTTLSMHSMNVPINKLRQLEVLG